MVMFWGSFGVIFGMLLKCFGFFGLFESDLGTEIVWRVFLKIAQIIWNGLFSFSKWQI